MASTGPPSRRTEGMTRPSRPESFRRTLMRTVLSACFLAACYRPAICASYRSSGTRPSAWGWRSSAATVHIIHRERLQRQIILQRPSGKVRMARMTRAPLKKRLEAGMFFFVAKSVLVWRCKRWRRPLAVIGTKRWNSAPVPADCTGPGQSVCRWRAAAVSWGR